MESQQIVYVTDCKVCASKVIDEKHFVQCPVEKCTHLVMSEKKLCHFHLSKVSKCAAENCYWSPFVTTTKKEHIVYDHCSRHL